MSGEFAGQVPKRKLMHNQRAERLRREIALLSGMDDRLWRKSLICAALIIPALALLFVGAAAKLHWLGTSPAIAIAGACLIALLCWWMGRYALWFPVVIVLLAVAVIFEDIPDVGDIGGDDRKTSRAKKIARALDKRRALLARLEAAP